MNLAIMKNEAILCGFALALLATGLVLAQLKTTELTNTNDLNIDGVVNFTDFSIALDRVNQVKMEISNQQEKANVIEEVYLDVPPYSPSN